jgi:Holliday junction resolvasome RuvABC endonuclease subunit
MNTYISFDISTKTIGIAVISIISNKIKVQSLFYISPEKKGSEFSRLLSLKNQILSIVRDIKLSSLFTKSDKLYVSMEKSPLYIPRKSSANTIVKLNIYTRIVGLTLIEELKIDPLQIPVQTIRATLKKLSKSPDKINKDDVPQTIETIMKRVNGEDWSFPYLKKKGEILKVKRGKYKGKYIEENYDLADSFAVALTHAFKIKDIK